LLFFFFFQAEDGIRDFHVTGVQTCALPIFSDDTVLSLDDPALDQALAAHARIGERRLGSTTEDRWSRTEQAGALGAGADVATRQIGRASCRERGESAGVGGGVKERAAGDAG